ncbi:MAG: nucleotidyltransferase, partial [Candidatus Eremiobacterota bacterium]
MREFERFLDIVRALEEEHVEYVVVGGAALNVLGLVRATEDVDLFIRLSSSN